MPARKKFFLESCRRLSWIIIRNFLTLVISLNQFRRTKRYQQFQPKHNSPLALIQFVKRFVIYCFLIFLISSVALVGLFGFLPTPTSAFMLHRHLEDIVSNHNFRAIDQRWVNGPEISKHAYTAVIASEDQLFYQHNGFDLDAIGKALKRYSQGGKLRGASTISQQVAKNLFLSPAKSFFRKGAEIWFTLLIELLWSKSRILEMYLNIAEFGDHLFGIEAASHRYFSIPAKQLSRNRRHCWLPPYQIH